MAPGGHYNCTATSCPACGCSFTVIIRIGASGTSAAINGNSDYWDSFSGFSRRVQKVTSAIERRRLRFERIHAMAKKPIEQAYKPIEALNAGMMLRRMRASSGLARART
jgi:hypothetical protein